MIEPTWQGLNRFCWESAQALARDWQCAAAPSRTEPSPEIDAECDAWLTQLTEGRTDAEPSPKARPWILARLLIAATSALGEQDRGVRFPLPEISPPALQGFLIEEWHSWMRQRWLDGGYDLRSFPA